MIGRTPAAAESYATEQAAFRQGSQLIVGTGTDQPAGRAGAHVSRPRLTPPGSARLATTGGCVDDVRSEAFADPRRVARSDASGTQRLGPSIDDPERARRTRS